MSTLRKMDGIIKIKSCVMLIIVLIIVSACKNEGNNNPQKIIEDNFLTLVDTFAYKYGTFRPSAPDPRGTVLDSPKYYPELAIYIYKKVENSKIAENEIRSFLKRKKLDIKFSNLITKEDSQFTLDSNFAKKIGKYNISFDTIKQKKFKYAGEVLFSNFKVSGDLGYFIIELSDGEDSSIGFIVLIEKRNGKWIVTTREPLYRT